LKLFDNPCDSARVLALEEYCIFRGETDEEGDVFSDLISFSKFLKAELFTDFSKLSLRLTDSLKLFLNIFDDLLSLMKCLKACLSFLEDSFLY
jgi:hypothetical protein